MQEDLQGVSTTSVGSPSSPIPARCRRRSPALRVSVALALVTCFAVAAFQVGVASAAPPVVWSFNGTQWAPGPPDNRTEGTVQFFGPKRSGSFEATAVRLVQYRGMTWSGWGRSTATIKGKARYCEFPDPCGAWKSITIKLSGRTSAETCGYRHYRAYRVTGHPALIKPIRYRAFAYC